MKILQAVGFASLLSVVTSSPAHTHFTIGKDINTTSGIIRGHAAANRTQVSQYLGIPFAKPPVNDLRFAAPESYRSNATFNATSFGTTCLAAAAPPNISVLTAEGYHLAPTADEFLDRNSEAGLSLGEDCLTLNVWTKPQTGEKAKAVLFFIYGGGFQGGYTASQLATGQFIADEEDVVVITANYRTNVFGFPSLQPEVSGVAANAGLLDQRLAIEWARDNVAGFGGDPARITLFGQSAGSMSIDVYSYAYAHDPIAHALIGQSGTSQSFGTAPSNSTASWESLSSILGCGNSSNTSTTALAQSVACVRSKPAAQVLAASLQVPGQASALGAFAPTADGVTVFANYTALREQGRFAQVPRILGSNAQEGQYFKLTEALAGLNLPLDVFWDFFTLVIFTCPTLTAASDYATIGSQKVWRYMYNGDYPNTQITIDPSLGAYHGAELRPLFGVSTIFGIPDTPAEYATGKLMRTAWAAFAKDPVNGLAAAPFAWPAYSGRPNASVVELGVGNATTASFQPSAASVDDLCPALMPGFEAIGGANGLFKYEAQALPLIVKLQPSNVTQVLDIFLQAAGLGNSTRR